MRKRNFAGQPAGGGNITILTGREILTDIAPSTPRGFSNQTLFIDNCKNCYPKTKTNTMFKNGDGYTTSGWDYENDMPIFSTQPSTGGTSSSTAKSTKSDGGFFSGLKLADILKPAVSIYTTEQQKKAAQEQGQLALEIEKQRLAQEKLKQEAEYAKAAASSAQAGTVVSKIKAYTVPLLVGGVVVIGGIAAYFYFKKKKIS